MAYDLRLEFRGDYLVASVSGDNTPQDVREYLAEIRAACETRGCSRVLVEENLSGPSLGTMDIYGIAEGAGRNAAGAITRIAYLDVNPEHATRDMEFAANVAANRGLNVRVFTDRREAAEWLSE
ncbi:MAG TPA: hypothetical protein VEH62_15390 [Gemmatimonadales bacterium]|nr:hypothetical protein [Gemmatimonadales bacterium]